MRTACSSSLGGLDRGCHVSQDRQVPPRLRRPFIQPSTSPPHPLIPLLPVPSLVFGAEYPLILRSDGYRR